MSEDVVHESTLFIPITSYPASIFLLDLKPSTLVQAGLEAVKDCRRQCGDNVQDRSAGFTLTYFKNPWADSSVFRIERGTFWSDVKALATE
ncbi:hypothetical protein EVAR_41340_1 [Eumeta japonica]|uniref:Uncharacterized protein n=1 Tax=Eumeta variegata TaxID=151549 RepID=A0A4C1X132_EUMVA|nr:hypothetical protein EVAR_41340_1 [Eumeta japonica]